MKNELRRISASIVDISNKEVDLDDVNAVGVGVTLTTFLLSIAAWKVPELMHISPLKMNGVYLADSIGLSVIAQMGYVLRNAFGLPDKIPLSMSIGPQIAKSLDKLDGS